jgi:hypothetical protein
VLDFLQGSTRSGWIHDNYKVNLTLEEETQGDPPGAYSATTKDPSIAKALNMPGDEGCAWEAACQATWANIVKYGMFGLPAEPLPGTKVLKTGTICHSSYHNGKLVKCKVRIVVKGFSQVPGVH